MSDAQDSVRPETTPASYASTSLQSSSVVDLAEDVIEYEIVTYYAAMPALLGRMRVWEEYGKTNFASLVPVVLKLLSCHATTCSTERNWSLWGRIYSAARNALGIARAKKMIAICTDTRQHNEDDFAVSLAVIDGEV